MTSIFSNRMHFWTRMYFWPPLVRYFIFSFFRNNFFSFFKFIYGDDFFDVEVK